MQLADLARRGRAGDRRSARGPAAGSATDGCRASSVELLGHRRPPGGSARSAPGPRSRSASSRSAWRAFSSSARRSARLLVGLGPPLAGAGQRVAVALELGEGQLALLDGRAPASTASSATLSRPGFFVALRREVVERLLELASWRGEVPRSAPLIDAWSRSRSAASSRSRSAQLVVADRGGRAEERPRSGCRSARRAPGRRASGR